MKRIVLLLILLMPTLTYGQPVPPTWRPPTGCATDDLMKFNGTRWICSGGSAVTGSGTSGRSTRWTGTSTLGTGAFTDDGSRVRIFSSDAFLSEDGAFSIRGASTATKKLAFGLDESLNHAWIEAVYTGVGYYPLKLVASSVDASQAMTVAGDLTSGDAVGDTFTATGKSIIGTTSTTLALFGGSTGYVYQYGDTLNFYAGTNGSATGYINYFGYAPGGTPGITQFRDMIVADGKGATVATFTGSSKNVTFASTVTSTGLHTGTAGFTTPANLTTTGTGDLVSADDLTVGDDATVTDALVVNGDFTAGDASTDKHRFNGETVIASGTVGGTINGMHLAFDSNIAVIEATQPGTSYRQLDINTSRTRLNIGGSNVVDTQSTGVAITGTLSTTSTLTAGDSTADTHTINGSVTHTEVDGVAYALTSTPSSVAGSVVGMNIAMNGSLNATAAARESYGISSVVTTTRGTGSNFTGNYGLYTTVSGGSNTNYAIYASASGNGAYSFVGGAGTFLNNDSAQLGDQVGDSHTLWGFVQSFEDVGSAITGEETGNINLFDTTSATTGTGGAITFAGYYNTTTQSTTGGLIKVAKTNSTGGNYSFDLVFGARQNGQSVQEGCRLLGDTKVLNCIGGLQVNGSNVAVASAVSGTTNTLAKFTSSSAVGNSSITDNGSGAIAATGSSDITFDLINSSRTWRWWSDNSPDNLILRDVTGSSDMATFTSQTAIFNKNVTLGDAAADVVKSTGTFGFGGTDASINSCGTSPSVSGEAQSFQLTVGSGVTSCVVNLNRTFTAAPYCTFSPGNDQASGDVAAAGGNGDSPYITSSTTTVTMTFDANTENSPIYNVTCFDRN